MYKINTQAGTAGSERHFVNLSFSFVRIYDCGGIERSTRKNLYIPQTTSFDILALTNPYLTRQVFDLLSARRL